ncbi:MAG: hypothetical protein U9N62_13850 [Thermotogota bacterium]|nr:hypothetical protein [Thermotogota bacterium]
MKKALCIILAFFLLFGVMAFSAFDDESFAAWSESIRKFSGMKNIQGQVDIHAELLDAKNIPYELFYSMKFYSRDLRDYRLDFESPRMLEGITILYQYREQLLYVLNIEKKEYAMQSFEAGQEIQFNPTTLLMEFLDFLISIDSIPLLNVYPKKTTSGQYIFRIQLSPPEILSLFEKEYPSINIYLDDNNEINKIILINEQTNEQLTIQMLDIKINASTNEIDTFFQIPLQDYSLIEYLGKNK